MQSPTPCTLYCTLKDLEDLYAFHAEIWGARKRAMRHLRSAGHGRGALRYLAGALLAAKEPLANLLRYSINVRANYTPENSKLPPWWDAKYELEGVSPRGDIQYWAGLAALHLDAACRHAKLLSQDNVPGLDVTSLQAEIGGLYDLTVELGMVTYKCATQVPPN